MSVMIEKIFLQILDMSVTASYCILAVMGLRWLFRKAPKRYSYLLWIVVAFRLMCPLAIDSSFSIFNLNLVPEMAYSELRDERTNSETQTGAGDGGIGENIIADQSGTGNQTVSQPGTSNFDSQTGMESGAPENVETGLADQYDNAGSSHVNLSESVGSEQTGQSGNTGGAVTNQGISGSADSRQELDTKVDSQINPGIVDSNQSGAENHSVRWTFIASWAWVGGVAALSIFMLASWIRLKVRLRFAVKIKNGVYEADGIHSAFVLGVIKPKIYLPVGLTREEQSWILLHENCHKWRKDYLIKMIASVLTMIYWFNPLIWVAWNSFCRDMEMSCDEMALEGASQEMRKAYSRTLLSVASDRKVSWHLTPAFGENSVKSRIKHVLSFKKPAVWAGGVFAVVLVVMLVVFGTNGKIDAQTESGSGQSDNTEAEMQSSEILAAEDTTEVSAEENDIVIPGTQVAAADRDKSVDWYSSVWEEYDNKTELDWTLEGLGSSVRSYPAYYTGFMDIHPGATQFEMNADYDEDGLTDRVYQRYMEETDSYEVYLFLGSGQVLQLEDDARTDYWIETADISNDGQKEIIYQCYTYFMGDGGENTNLAIYEKTDGQWKRMSCPYMYASGTENCSSFFLTSFLLKGIDEDHIKITHRDYEGEVIASIEGLSDELREFYSYYIPEVGKVKSVEFSVSHSDQYVIYYDEAAGCTKIRCFSKYISQTVMWEISCRNGQWKMENLGIYGPGKSEILSLNIEKTEQNLISPEKVHEVLGKSLGSMRLNVSDNGMVKIWSANGGWVYKGWCEFDEQSEQDTIEVFADPRYASETIPETLRLTGVTENGESYYVTEYNGEKLYWDRTSRDMGLGIAFNQENILLCQVVSCVKNESGYLISGNLYWDLVFDAEQAESVRNAAILNYENGYVQKRNTKIPDVYFINQGGAIYPESNLKERALGYAKLQEETVDGEKTGRIELVSVRTGERIALDQKTSGEYQVSDRMMIVNQDGTETPLLEYLASGADANTVEGLTVRIYPEEGSTE